LEIDLLVMWPALFQWRAGSGHLWPAAVRRCVLVITTLHLCAFSLNLCIVCLLVCNIFEALGYLHFNKLAGSTCYQYNKSFHVSW